MSDTPHHNQRPTPSVDDGWDSFQAALRRANDAIEPADALRERIAQRMAAMPEHDADRAVIVETTLDMHMLWPRMRRAAAMAAVLMLTATLAWLAVPRSTQQIMTPGPVVATASHMANTDSSPVIVALKNESRTIVRPIASSRDDISIIWMHAAHVPPTQTNDDDTESTPMMDAPDGPTSPQQPPSNVSS